MANRNGSLNPAPLPSWKVWASALVGSLLLAQIIIFGGIGEGEAFMKPGEKAGYAIGTGLALGFVMWAAILLLQLRAASRVSKLLVFVAIAAAGTAATYTQVG